MRDPASRVSVGLVVVLLTASLGLSTAASESTIRVAQDGSGDYQTITAAIEAAADGDTVLVAPGTYQEGLEIATSIVLAGGGPRDEVIIAPALDQLPRRELSWSDDVPVAVYVEGGDTVIEGLTIKAGGEVPALWFVGGRHEVRDVETEGMLGVREEADALIEDSVLQFTTFALDAGGIVRNNRFSDSLFLNQRADVVVEGNTFALAAEPPGIAIVDPGTVAEVRGNAIDGGWVGIVADFPAAATIEDNTIDGSEVGIILVESASIARSNDIRDVAEVGIVVVGDGVLVEDNTIRGGRMGLHAEPDPGRPDAPDLTERSRIEGNSISGASHFGLVVEGSRPIVSGNQICADREPLSLKGQSDPVIGTNEICEVDEG